MPVMAAVIGYLTKLLAVRMLFEPLEYRGIRPFLGWQGMIPARAGKMAAIAYDTMTSGLIDLQELMSRIDPDELVAELAGPLDEAVEDLARELLSEYQPGLWESLPEPVRALLVRRVQAEAPKVVKQLAREVTSDVHAVVDVRHMVVSNLVRDKELLNRLIRDVAEPELRFIVRSGIYFGAAIGVIQAVAWGLTKSPLVMPIFGFLTGWVTDYLALNMLFLPREEKRFLGIRLHGKFQRRRAEVGVRYGDLIAKEILTPRNLLEGMLSGPKSDKLVAIVQREVRRTIDEQAGLAKPLVILAVGGRRFQALKQDAAARVIRTAPETARSMFAYTEQALDIRNTIAERMKVLTSGQFEQIIRPAFKEDEKTAVMVGAVLGGVIGEMQALVLIYLPMALGILAV
ncbi:DUF445 domain-containing protein [Haloechinothrix sp. YIM 98757]|uniref:DUF445 domain-containing protein n=1 Tax=Haloechinothrix aidingensis TaxID=2752311 RepID=A0A838ADU1_9PSEU|nr:DUF445 domain-containing protein [Haloechinothrix aidingensis]MBA0127325.1 DUF445 domain-containing protein [Haloechinothrix aidingensis]